MPPGALSYSSEPFCDPNSSPFKLIVPNPGGTQGAVQVTIALGTWGNTIYKVYPSIDGITPVLGTALLTLNTTTYAGIFDCSTSYFIVVLDTVHGTAGSLHRIQATTAL